MNYLRFSFSTSVWCVALLSSHLTANAQVTEPPSSVQDLGSQDLDLSLQETEPNLPPEVQQFEDQQQPYVSFSQNIALAPAEPKAQELQSHSLNHRPASSIQFSDIKFTRENRVKENREPLFTVEKYNSKNSLFLEDNARHLDLLFKTAHSAKSLETDPGFDAINLLLSQASLQTEDQNTDNSAIDKVELSYFRDFEQLQSVLMSLDMIGETKGVRIIKQADDRDVVLIYGKNDQDITNVRRVISALDLPRPEIDLQMWGIQISSNDSDDLAKVMIRVNKEINRTQRLIKESIGFIRGYVRNLEEQKCSSLSTNNDPIQSVSEDYDLSVNKDEFACLVEKLGYKDALSKNRPLSLSDIFIHLVSAEGKNNKITEILANRLYSFMKNDTRKRYDYFLKDIEKKQDSVPFERFFSGRGLALDCNSKKDAERPKQPCIWQENGAAADQFAMTARASILDFGFQYVQFLKERHKFDPYFFQQSTDMMNSGVQYVFNALNKDIEDLFVLPTLRRIQRIVGKFGDVQYAQVGRTSLAGLSGLNMEVTTNIESVYEGSPPLTLIDLLTRMNEVRDELPPGIIPQINTAFPNLSGSFPLETVVSALGALGQDRRVWQKLSLGNSLSLTPKILRNNTSAELTFDMTISSPDALNSHVGTVGDRNDDPFPPVSRISSQHVKTTIYADAIDLFAFSTFSNQSTRAGGRGYFPLVGPIWRGIFGDIPFLGKLFSWRRAPKNVRHESILLTNSYITPTAMGLVQLYPIGIGGQEGFEPCNFVRLQKEIENYTQTAVHLSRDIHTINLRCPL